MLTTDDGAIDARLRLLRQHGMSVPDTVRHQATQVSFEEYPIVGFNYRMTDIQAAIGREQLKRLPEMVSRRRQLAARYNRALSGVPGVLVPVEPEWARTNWQSYAIRVAPGTQRTVMQCLLDEGISTRRGVMNAHLEASYPPGTWRAAGGDDHPAALRCSEDARDTAIVLPLFHDLDEGDQDRIVDAVRRAVAALA